MTDAIYEIGHYTGRMELDGIAARCPELAPCYLEAAGERYQTSRNALATSGPDWVALGRAWWATQPERGEYGVMVRDGATHGWQRSRLDETYSTMADAEGAAEEILETSPFQGLEAKAVKLTRAQRYADLGPGYELIVGDADGE